jgi:hypothetical protein
MTDFLTDLEGELIRVAQRRAASSQASAGPSARAARRVADLRELASGGLLAVSAGVVAVVLAVVAVSGANAPSVRGGLRPSAGTGTPVSTTGPHPSASLGQETCRSVAAAPALRWTSLSLMPPSGLGGLLRVGHRVTGRQRLAVLRNLDQTVAEATSVYARDVRMVRLAHGTRVILVGADACATVGLGGGAPGSSGPLPSVLAEVRSVNGVATIPLGTVAQIRSGAVFRDRALLLKGRSGPESVAMVPSGVVRVICHDLAGSATTRQFPVVDQMVVVSGVSAVSHCDLVRSGSSATDA